MRKLLCVSSLTLLSACASIISDNDSTTYIKSEPVEKARCELHGQDFTRVIFTPDSVNLPADAAPITVACKADGYRNTTKELDTSTDGWVFGNIIFGGIIGGVVDIARGAGQKYPPQITIILDPESFDSITARDDYYATRTKAVTAKWDKAIEEIKQQCSGRPNDKGGSKPDCTVKVNKANELKAEELKEVEAKKESSVIN